MAELHKIVATVKTALEAGATAAPPPSPPASSAVPVTSTAQRAELASRFARELEAVAGRFLGVVAPAEAPARAVALAREIGARSVAIGAGVVNDARAIATALEDAGLAVVHSAPIRSAAERAAMRAGMAQSDLGIAEAHCAIAATGTLAVIATEHRPAALTLLPPASLIIVDIDRDPPRPRRRARDDRPRPHREPSRVAHHRPQPHRGYRKAHRARRARPQGALRTRDLAAQ